MTRNTVKTYCATYFILGLEGNLMIQSEKLSRDSQKQRKNQQNMHESSQLNDGVGRIQRV